MSVSFLTRISLAAAAALALSLGVVGAAAAQQPGGSAVAKANMCVGCHEIPGYRSVFPEVFPVPKIVGQRAKYIEYALRQYRSGTRMHHPSMTSIASQLSDDDIAQLATYYSELQP